MTRDRQIEIADWMVDTCLAFGTSTATAYKVAGLFIEALENNGKVETEETNEWTSTESDTDTRIGLDGQSEVSDLPGVR